jgi:hypothetical protein
MKSRAGHGIKHQLKEMIEEVRRNVLLFLDIRVGGRRKSLLPALLFLVRDLEDKMKKTSL